MAKGTVKTYTAFFQHDHSCIVYRRRPDDGTLDKLPQQATPVEGSKHSTYFRTDGGDRFEFAFFKTSRGQLITIQRDDYVPYVKSKD